jgi:Uncharacterised protein family (UPF0158)
MAKKLRVDIFEVADAMESSFNGEHHHYLDTETGEVILIPDEILSAIQDHESEEVRDFRDWEKSFAEDAKKIESDKHKRYIEIPALESWEGYRHMEAFAETVRDKSLQEKLAIALDGKGAFGRFKNALLDYPTERERWFEFKNKQMAEEVRQWLESIEIEPTSEHSVSLSEE